MTTSSDARRTWVMLLLVACAAVAANGCSRTKHRLQADREAYETIAERNVDPRWYETDYGIEMDPRSRYFDPCDPDRPPMPLDDPASHRYMHCVDGKKGWKHWKDNGVRLELENPAWCEALRGFVEISEDGSLQLDVDSALNLAYVHSPSYQNQLETLYLSSLDVTAERFRLDTQFFGGYDTRYVHQGALSPPQIAWNPTFKRFVVLPAIDGVENNLLTVGRPLGANPALKAQRRFATAGELLVGFANSFVFEFTGSDANLAASLANFTFIQPLLRGAGRDVALEQLTNVERDLLANLRAYSQYRQGFYTQVAIGELGVVGPQRGGGSTNLAVFSGRGDVGGYVGLLQQLQLKRNTEDNLSLQERTLARLKAFEKIGAIDLVQVDQFRQSIQNEQARLLRNRNDYEFALDRYKTGTLGLPPNLPIDLDDSLIHQFQLVARKAFAVEGLIVELQDRVEELWDDPKEFWNDPEGLWDDAGNLRDDFEERLKNFVKLRDDVGIEDIRQVIAGATELVEPVRVQLEDVQADVAHMEQTVSVRERTMTDEDKKEFADDREQLREELEALTQKFHEAVAEMDRLRDGLSEQTQVDTARKLVVWAGDLVRLVQRSILVQARARLEAVSVETIELGSRDAFEIALANRMDFMNGRAALVDSWRIIQFNADALQSVLNVTASGDLRTSRNNPVSFRAPTGKLRLGLEFDAPLTRLLERNDYRESLIKYQRSRRDFIQSRDSLHQGLRELLRQIEQHRENLEIQRRAVTIAIQRVDSTQARLYAPVPPPQPGQRVAPFNSTTAINLLSAQSALRETQNSFMSAWLNYYAAKMRLARELGIMMLDQDGRWIDFPPPSSSLDDSLDSDNPGVEELPLPPAIPTQWIQLANFVEAQPNGLPTDIVEPAGNTGANRPHELRRLPPPANTWDANGYDSLQRCN